MKKYMFCILLLTILPIVYAGRNVLTPSINFFQYSGSSSNLTEEFDPYYFLNPLGYLNLSSLPASTYNDDWINTTIDNKILNYNTTNVDYILWVNSTNGVGTGSSYDDSWIIPYVDNKTNDLDGGFANSVYLTEQLIDGGGA